MSIERPRRVWEGDLACRRGGEEEALDGGIPWSEGLAVALAAQPVEAAQ
jgi:hypothetical protein